MECQPASPGCWSGSDYQMRLIVMIITSCPEYFYVGLPIVWGYHHVMLFHVFVLYSSQYQHGVTFLDDNLIHE